MIWFESENSNLNNPKSNPIWKINNLGLGVGLFKLEFSYSNQIKSDNFKTNIFSNQIKSNFSELMYDQSNQIEFLGNLNTVKLYQIKLFSFAMENQMQSNQIFLSK